VISVTKEMKLSAKGEINANRSNEGERGECKS
jgi:hypothetical protein